jgi:hypothetical protein
MKQTAWIRQKNANGNKIYGRFEWAGINPRVVKEVRGQSSTPSGKRF